ncbi:hypothetical protein SteCoe_23426 [Stentor coeruleus]|uniref:Uncharacterized protein n=1 Tax=Stentor coeruleus TaxID=5963 RepID=A0A1R2BJY8_9CILI|nr:hypothetical protein SteCoe_23426 [Stentor coeruleus]
MEEKSHLKPVSETLFKPCYWQYIEPWLQTATKSEIKGLKILQAIAKHKGNKRFKIYEKPQQNDYESAAVDLRRKTMQSYYTTQYSSLSPERTYERTHESEILNFKRLSELKYSSVLKDHILSLTEKWISLDDDIKYRDLIIITLQGFHSVCKINENVPVTTSQDTFYWFSTEERHRNNFPISTLNMTSRNFKSIPKRRNSVGIESKGPLEPMKSFFEPKYFQERMTRKMRGSGDFVTWIYDKNMSMYQNAFASKINNCPAQVAKPANSSTIIRVLPIENLNR